MESRFIETQERRMEASAGKMLYHDFGTACSGLPHGYKNPPNVHIFPFSKDLLALSEASHPTRIDKDSLASLGLWNFAGRLPPHVTFTAHPKIDPKSGDIFAYGISRSLKPEIKVYRISAADERMTEISSFALGGFYPIHDMLMTENYVLFVVSPLKINLLKAASMRGPVSEALEYDGTQPLRILVLRKDGRGGFKDIGSAPSGFIFHHVNAFEEADKGLISFDSFVLENNSVYEVFKAWSSAKLPPTPSTAITRFQIDLETSKVVARFPLATGLSTDFPCIDGRMIGQPLRFFHALESNDSPDDPLAFNTLTRWDLDTNTAMRVKSKDGQIFGEAIYVAGPQNDLLLHLGYDGSLDETFLDMREVNSLHLLARVWLGRYLPLGFHGSFVS